MTKHTEIYACLYAKEFPAQALLRLRPELRNKPCVVMEGEPPLQQVCSLARKARSLGIARGMTQVEVDTFSEVTVLQRSSKAETAAREVLLECAGCYSPRVEDCSRDNSFLCALDIAGTTGLFGPPETLARNLLTRVSALGITACVAVSSNFYAAVAVARAPLSLLVRVIPTGEESTALAALPLTVLDISEEQAETFALWGIRTLGMLAALPEKELISRMGQAGKRLREMARGEMPHLFQPVEPAFTLAERMELDSPIELLDALMFVVNLMLEQIVLRTTARVLALASVSITLTLEGGTKHTRTVLPALPTSDRLLWLKLLHLDLEAHPPQAAILAIALDAEPGSISKVQLGLFSPQLPEPSRLGVTMARIRAIVGDENARRIVLEDTHRPDAFRIEPFAVPVAQPQDTSAPSARPAMRRLRPAESLTVIFESQHPKAFFFHGQRYAVECANGPWRTEGDWWNATQWRCEQWDLTARTQDGATLCCCLIRDLIREQWQMAGVYD
jgi:protein ImuB